MTKDAINRAIAEWRGWKCEGHPVLEEYCAKWVCGSRPWAINPEGKLVGSTAIPNYYGDLNAIAEAEGALLGQVGWVHYSHVLLKDNIHAKAPQRCEALLRTLNLWKE